MGKKKQPPAGDPATLRLPCFHPEMLASCRPPPPLPQRLIMKKGAPKKTKRVQVRHPVVFVPEGGCKAETADG